MTDTTLPQARVEHRLPGRLRLRIAARLGEGAWFEAAAAALSAMPEVDAVRVNPSAASLLVMHRGDERAVLAAARAGGLFDLATAVPSRVVPRAASARPAALNVAAAGFAAAGALQVVRGRVLGSATDSLWNAYLLSAGTRPGAPVLLLAAIGLLQLARGEVLGAASSLFLYAWRARAIASHRPVGIV